jgi:hypothetical protein
MRANASISHGTRFTGRKFERAPPGAVVVGRRTGAKRSVSTKLGMTSIAHGRMPSQKWRAVSRARDSETAVAASLAEIRYWVSGA